MSRTNFIPQNSISEHLNLKHARHEATTSPETKAPPMPEIAIQKLSDIVYTYTDICFQLSSCKTEPLKFIQLLPLDTNISTVFVRIKIDTRVTPRFLINRLSPVWSIPWSSFELFQIETICPEHVVGFGKKVV
jgi:hypothetical protein